MNKPTKYLTIVLLLAVLGASAFYLSTSERFLGFIQLRPAGISPGAVTVDLPWWCISEEEWNSQWDDSGKPTTDTGEDGVVLSPWDISGTIPGSKIDFIGPSSIGVDFEGTDFSKDEFLPDKEGVLPIKGESEEPEPEEDDDRVSGYTFTVEGGTGRGVVIIPKVIIDKDSGAPGTEPSPEQEMLYLWYSCDCDDSKIYVPELNQMFACPAEYGDTSYYEVEGVYKLSVMTPREYQCNKKWFCPDGYTEDWNQIKEDCDTLELAYDDVCNNESADDFLLEACTAFRGTWFLESLENWQKDLDNIGDGACVSEEDCADFVKLVNKGVFTGEVTDISYDEAAGVCYGLDYTGWSDWYGQHLYPEAK